MASNLESSERVGAEPTSAPAYRRRGLVRRVIFPLVVIAAIVGAIWWLERDDGGKSPTGERYGPVDLPASLRPAGAGIAAEEGALAPDFLLERLEGGELRLSDLRGQPVVLNFWATWCRPCRKEIPQFVAAYDRYSEEGLVVLGVNLQEGRSIVTPYAEDYGMDFPIVIDRDGEVGDEYRLLGLPVTFFIDEGGLIKSVFTGPFVEEEKGTNVQGAIEQGVLTDRIQEILTPAGNETGDR